MSFFTTTFDKSREKLGPVINDNNLYEVGINPLWNELVRHFNRYYTTNIIKGKQIDVITDPGKSSEVDDFLQRFGCYSVKNKRDYQSQDKDYLRKCKCGDIDVLVTVTDRKE